MRAGSNGGVRGDAVQIVDAYVESAAREVGRQMPSQISKTDESVAHCRSS
jgi:hypothetical protein